MTNKPRPKCPADGNAMVPLFIKRPRGSGMVRAHDLFECRKCENVARGRRPKTVLTKAGKLVPMAPAA